MIKESIINPRVSKVKAHDDYQLKFTFTNGEHGCYDCSSFLEIDVFQALKDKSYFNLVQVVDSTVLSWSDEQDICSVLYI